MILAEGVGSVGFAYIHRIPKNRSEFAYTVDKGQSYTSYTQGACCPQVGVFQGDITGET